MFYSQSIGIFSLFGHHHRDKTSSPSLITSLKSKSYLFGSTRRIISLEHSLYAQDSSGCVSFSFLFVVVIGCVFSLFVGDFVSLMMAEKAENFD